MLEIDNLCVRYGQIDALTEVSLTVGEGETVTVLGSNGAGKSTLLNTLIGLQPVRSGTCTFLGTPLARQHTGMRIRDGMVLVPEGRRILISQTIEENILLGAFASADHHGAYKMLEALYTRFPNLAERRHAKAACLSGGEQQMLAIARAMVAQPKLLMLDEPTLGLSPLFVTQLFDLLAELKRQGVAILLVEQNVDKALALSDRAYVLERGLVRFAGTAAEVVVSKELAKAYFGAGEET